MQVDHFYVLLFQIPGDFFSEGEENEPCCGTRNQKGKMKLSERGLKSNSYVALHLPRPAVFRVHFPGVRLVLEETAAMVGANRAPGPRGRCPAWLSPSRLASPQGRIPPSGLKCSLVAMVSVVT